MHSGKEKKFLDLWRIIEYKMSCVSSEKMIHYLYRWYMALSPRAYHLTTWVTPQWQMCYWKIGSILRKYCLDTQIMDWRGDIGRKSQYQRIPDHEAAGLKSSKVCRVCRVFCMIMIQKSRAVCQRVPSVCQSVSKSAECPKNHTFAKVLPPHQSNLVRRFLRL